jgi:hypothetical protein
MQGVLFMLFFPFSFTVMTKAGLRLPDRRGRGLSRFVPIAARRAAQAGPRLSPRGMDFC